MEPDRDVRRAGRDDRQARVREPRGQRRRRRGQRDRHALSAHRDAGDAVRLARLVCVLARDVAQHGVAAVVVEQLRRHGALDRVADGLGGHRVARGEPQPGPQLERVGAPVARDGGSGARQLGLDRRGAARVGYGRHQPGAAGAPEHQVAGAADVRRVRGEREVRRERPHHLRAAQPGGGLGGALAQADEHLAADRGDGQRPVPDAEPPRRVAAGIDPRHRRVVGVGDPDGSVGGGDALRPAAGRDLVDRGAGVVDLPDPAVLPHRHPQVAARDGRAGDRAVMQPSGRDRPAGVGVEPVDVRAVAADGPQLAVAGREQDVARAVLAQRRAERHLGAVGVDPRDPLREAVRSPDRRARGDHAADVLRLAGRRLGGNAGQPDRRRRGPEAGADLAHGRRGRRRRPRSSRSRS